MRNTTIAFFAVGIAALPLTAARNITAGDALNLINVEFSRNIPAESWAPQDPADAIWRSGRAAISNAEWQKAAEIFRRIHTESGFKTSTYRGQSYYWEAYARTQMGGSTQLRQAAALLRTLKSDFPDDAKSIRDSSSLLASVEGRLSREYGDEDAAANVRESAKGTGTKDCPDTDDDDNPRIAALNALLQMSPDDAMPLVEKVVARRDECSAGMRAKAMWLIAQKKSPRSADILVDAAKNDPNSEVRQQAVFWLSQVDGAKALDAIKDILATSKDQDLQENALFALSRNNDSRAAALLKEYAVRSDISSDVRGTAIHWLGQNKENASFLRDLFTKVNDEDSKEQIIFAVSQQNTAESAEWLMNIVMNDNVNSDIRKTALYWAAQNGASRNKNSDQATSSPNSLTPAKLVAMYDRVTDQELKEQLIFLYAQRHETQYVDKLMDIAKADKKPELRKTAIYWLGQVGAKDPRVMKFLTDLINGG